MCAAEPGYLFRFCRLTQLCASHGKLEREQMNLKIIQNELRQERELIDRAIMELLKIKREAPALKTRRQADKLMWMRQNLRRKLDQTPALSSASTKSSTTTQPALVIGAGTHGRTRASGAVRGTGLR